ncbi:MFS transporter [Micromonospora sp. S-DT3-3-22]|uniref:MFS transporter n=1 Tax=Micromonospora sp. S-DT3-3-22 TaxID=2755359 RepID=UPI00188F1FCD|nr:MFS transporter [Micromonospora sp. S-DT3-3-22]
MRRPPALSFLLVTVVLDMLGLGLVVPVVPALLADVAGDAAAAARWSGLLGSVYGLLQFVVAPLLGRLADRYGRRPVLLGSVGCLGVDWLAHAASPAPWTLLLFHALAGACAGTYTVVNAYLADVTAPGARARAYGLVGAASGLGFVAGPTVGGLLGVVWLAGTAFVTAPWLLYLLLAVGVLASTGGAAAQSWLSRVVPADGRGTVQGALTGVGAAAETVVPVLAGTAFAWSLVHASPGLVFVGAAVFAAGSTLLLVTTPDLRQP